MPFSSTTLPTDAFLTVTLSPPSSNAEYVGLMPPASMLMPSNVTFDASLIICRSTTPGAPRNVNVLEPDGVDCDGYVPAATETTSPDAAMAYARSNVLHGADAEQDAESEP